LSNSVAFPVDELVDESTHEFVVSRVIFPNEASGFVVPGFSKSLNYSATGAKCNSPGQRPGLGNLIRPKR
jgi:hypothetical protein